MTTSDSGSRPRPRFRKRAETTVGAADPEALFGELPRTPNGVGALWSHQADQLRTYAQEHRQTPDVALELPTGSGKTLVGLLISEWRRRTLGQRVVYACPTKQLARQVFNKANDQGIPVVLLIGSHRSWDPADLARYTRGDTIAVTTYSAIFNLNSHLSDAQTLVFDDAHAAEGFVAEAWALSVSSEDDTYEQLLDAFGDALEPSLVTRMLAPDGPAADSSEVRLIPLGAVAQHETEIDRVLAGLDGDAMYRFKMVRANLASCLFYVSRREFYIRPMIPRPSSTIPSPARHSVSTSRRPSETPESWNAHSDELASNGSPYRQPGTGLAAGAASSLSRSSHQLRQTFRWTTMTAPSPSY